MGQVQVDDLERRQRERAFVAEIAEEATHAIGRHPHHITLERWIMAFHRSETEDIPRSALHGSLRHASEEARRHGSDALANELDELLRQVDLWPMVSG
jgi:hypothetical protein